MLINSIHDNNATILWTSSPLNESFLKQTVMLTDQEKHVMEQIVSPRRREEWLATRYIVQKTFPKAVISYNENRKPSFLNQKESISISHCKEIVAIIIHSEGHAVGIDCETISSKVKTVAHKFAKTEMSLMVDISLPELTVIWCAKEALYKLYSQGSIDFNEHLRIDSFDFCVEGGTFTGRILKNSEQQYTMHYRSIGNSILVWICE